MFKVYEYNKNRHMSIVKESANPVSGDLLVLEDGDLRAIKNTDTLTLANLYSFYFCNEKKKNTVDGEAPVQYVGALPISELFYGSLDLAAVAVCGTGLTIKSGVIAVAVANDIVFARVEEANGYVSGAAVETKFSTFGGKSTAAQCATPTFTPAAGAVASASTVAIACSTANSIIRYTTSGTAPTETTGTVYTEAIAITAGVTIKAIAIKQGFITSAVGSAAYTIS